MISYDKIKISEKKKELENLFFIFLGDILYKEFKKMLDCEKDTIQLSIKIRNFINQWSNTEHKRIINKLTYIDFIKIYKIVKILIECDIYKAVKKFIYFMVETIENKNPEQILILISFFKNKQNKKNLGNKG